MNDLDPIRQNIEGVRQLIGSKLNKQADGAAMQQEGAEGVFEDELSLKLDDEELLSLARTIEGRYASYESGIKVRQEANKAWYLGRQGGSGIYTDGQAISANLLFEAVETFLPAALAKNPEPVVYADNTEQGNAISNDVKTMLQYHADVLAIRTKLAQMTRNWLVDLLAVVKYGWNDEISEIECEVRDVKNFVFDPDGYVDCYGDFVGVLGERVTITASRLIELFPSFKEFIVLSCDGKLGTDVVYTEWWSDKYTFITYKGKVFDKSKVPNYNYDQKETKDEEGNTITPVIAGKNHFATPKKPYTFLSVFSFGDHPHDETGLIEQNIPNQRRVTRTTEQIDYNLASSNNSLALNEGNFNQETGKQFAQGRAKGHPLLVPQGTDFDKSFKVIEMTPVDASHFNALETSKNDLRTIFGTQGITATPQDEDQTARGMILNNQYDSTRIGGGIGDALERVAKSIFNWLVQMYYVYYDENHVAAVLGQLKATEYITLSSQKLTAKLVVSVSPDSMKPKDELTIMNQALELWGQKALDIKTLLTILNFPDPQDTAAQVWLYQTNPQLYGQMNFPELTQQIQALMAQQQPQPQAQGGGGNPQQIQAPQPPTTGVSSAGASLQSVPLPA